MGSESEDPLQDKKDRRKKRTSSSQYAMYLEMMEEDPIFASGKVPRDVDATYIPKKWIQLANKLNTCSTGPKLTADEWRKRLNDWKNTTRSKYRRSITGDKDITLTSLENKALELFGKAAINTNQSGDSLILLKEEKLEEDGVEEHQRSTTLQKQLQAAVDEAIRDGDNEDEEDDEDALQEDSDEPEIITMPMGNTQTHDSDGGGGRSNNTSGSTYRTIVVENAGQYVDEDNAEEFITNRRSMAQPTTSGSTIQTVVTASTPATTVTKLINGDIPLKRLRSQTTEQIIYEVKKAPTNQRVITGYNIPSTTQYQAVHQSQQQQHRTIDIGNNFSLTSSSLPSEQGITSQDAREIGRQLKRLADIKAEKLKFDVARFKFNNPGFNFNLRL